MKDILKKLFAPTEPVAIAATVVRRIRQGLYELTDDAGRTIQADSPDAWATGDRVRIESGRIIGFAAMAPTIKIYEV